MAVGPVEQVLREIEGIQRQRLVERQLALQERDLSRQERKDIAEEELNFRKLSLLEEREEQELPLDIKAKRLDIQSQGLANANSIVAGMQRVNEQAALFKLNSFRINAAQSPNGLADFNDDLAQMLQQNPGLLRTKEGSQFIQEWQSAQKIKASRDQARGLQNQAREQGLVPKEITLGEPGARVAFGQPTQQGAEPSIESTQDVLKALGEGFRISNVRIGTTGRPSFGISRVPDTADQSARKQKFIELNAPRLIGEFVSMTDPDGSPVLNPDGSQKTVLVDGRLAIELAARQFDQIQAQSGPGLSTPATEPSRNAPPFQLERLPDGRIRAIPNR